MVDIIAQTRDEHTTMRTAPTAAGGIHRNDAAAGFTTFCHQHSGWRRTYRFISSRADTVIGQGLPLLAIDMMAGCRATLGLLLLGCCSLSSALPPSSAPAMAPSLSSEIPTVRIQSRVPLPTLPVLQDSYTLNIGVARIVGPGDNTSADDPYVEFTGRVYNSQLVSGLVRVKQGAVPNSHDTCFTPGRYRMSCLSWAIYSFCGLTIKISCMSICLTLGAVPSA